MNRIAHAVTCIALSALLLTPWTPAWAGLVSTADALSAEQQQTSLATVEAFLEREDVVAKLTELGVDPVTAQQRVAALSPAEQQQLAMEIENETAGGDVIAVLGVIFVVLLVLELVGVIDIFKKT
ncbi:MAG: PA2779 family protein [Xanthomonadales bacterium]|nr:PA2779 family protein [Xanthomonadales bacterium]